MALPSFRLTENIEGEFFVDSSCIDCDACRQIAPATFHDHGGQSSVYQQPADEQMTTRALMALVACPTASIGTVSKRSPKLAVAAFPEPIAGDVYFCGFTAESSFGAWSYLVARPPERGGNVLVDSPRFSLPLVRRIEEMGGVNLIYLTHRDDVADHERYAAHFGAPRVMHEAENAARFGVERVLTGQDATLLDADLLSIPTPGHTRGHQVLLYQERALFTGDHLAWSPRRHTLTAFRDACWYSWSEQIGSMKKLRAHAFSSVLPGHGRIHHDTPEAMRTHLERCIAWMEGAKS